MMIPRKIWIWSICLASIRLLGFLLIYTHRSHDAQWQLQYWPLWVIDFPISQLYFVSPLPWGEGVLGPLWWFSLPLILWRYSRSKHLENKHH